jgi:azurin
MKRNFALLACVLSLAASELAFSQECALTVEGNDSIQFVQKELRASSSCKEVTVTLKHIGTLAANIMGHNFVLSKTEDYMALAQAGQAAGAPNYLPAGDARVIAATNIIGGGQETTVTFATSALQQGGDYTFFCTFPGHFVLMNGKFIVE